MPRPTVPEDHGALEATGELENTLVVFTSDRGELLGEYRSYGKRRMHDSAARVPLLARLPGRFDGGRTVSQATSLVDLAPAFLAAAGAELSTHELDGVDLAEAAAGTVEREYVYSAPDTREYFIDRVGDPAETRNRAGVKLFADRKEPAQQART